MTSPKGTFAGSRSVTSLRSKLARSARTTAKDSLSDWFCAPAFALACDPLLATKDHNDEVLATSVLAYEGALAFKCWMKCS